jgi:endonuclease YncB( thermonuclease family)
LNIKNLIQILISIFRNIKKFTSFYYVFGIVFFLVAGLAIELTYGDTSTRLDPNIRELAGKDNHPNYKFQYFFPRNLNQNVTNDVELVGIVTEVVDGDTLDINGTRIRLALVDTPERGQSGFDEAKKFVESLCLGKKGELDVDNGQRRGDRYGREIGVVYCEGINVNEKLMNNRLARILTEFCDISEFSNESWAAPRC